jgi:cytochrome c peroxidase
MYRGSKCAFLVKGHGLEIVSGHHDEHHKESGHGEEHHEGDDHGHKESGGLDLLKEYLEEIKQNGNHITALLSYSDLLQLGGYCAVEYTGGPSMHFRMGRQDSHEAADHLFDPNTTSLTNIEDLDRMGLSKQEMVALLGSHTVGFA